MNHGDFKFKKWMPESTRKLDSFDLLGALLLSQIKTLLPDLILMGFWVNIFLEILLNLTPNFNPCRAFRQINSLRHDTKGRARAQDSSMPSAISVLFQ
jgi:hypothetical protein